MSIAITSSYLEQLSQDLMPTIYEVGAVIMEIHQRQIATKIKPDGSPVSEADEAAEAILLPALAKFAPDIPVVSEENAASHKLDASPLFFLVDPIDGTKEYLKPDGQGSFTVNIGLVQNGMPVMGLVYAPAFDDLYVGIVGHQAFKINGSHKTALKVRDVPETGVVAVASASHRDETTNSWLAMHKIEQTRSIGSSLKFCLLADGKADVYPRFAPTMEWDTAAGDAVLRAAGGLVMTPDYKPYPYGKQDYRNDDFIATGKWSPS